MLWLRSVTRFSVSHWSRHSIAYSKDDAIECPAPANFKRLYRFTLPFSLELMRMGTACTSASQQTREFSGHLQCSNPCPLYPRKRTCAVQLGMSALGHVWTAPGWQELFSRLQRWSVRPCVRPFSAALMTAGHHALRASGRGQWHTLTR